MSRITKKGQVTIPKIIRDFLEIKPDDIGEFTVKEGTVVFTVKKGTVFDSHRIIGFKEMDHQKQRKLMEEEIALEVTEEIK